MEEYTVCFFGHRVVESHRTAEERLEKLVEMLLRVHGFVTFLVGREGEFDLLAASVIRRCRKRLGEENSTLIWVLPYPKADVRDHGDEYLTYYDEIEVCEASVAAHPKAAIQIRNRHMADRADLAVFWVTRPSGGASRTMRYALRQGKRIVNLAHPDGDLFIFSI